jgi:hypothetical protein
MEDLDSALSGVDTVQITWNNIDIMGSECLQFSGRFASAGSTSFENSDFVIVEYQFSDDAPSIWTTLVEFRVSNKKLRLNGDSAFELSENALVATASIVNADLSLSLNLRLRASVDNSEENVAVDSLALINGCSQSQLCSTASDCSFRGLCNATGQCECFQGYQGPSCLTRGCTVTCNDPSFECMSGQCEQQSQCNQCQSGEPGYCNPFAEPACNQVGL